MPKSLSSIQDPIFCYTLYLINSKWYCNTRQNFNELAEQWIKNTGLKRMYGTDYHAKYHMVGAGILTDEEIKTNEQLVDILKNQQFKVTDGKRVFELN